MAWKVEFFCRRNSFNKMIRKIRRPIKRMSSAFRRKFHKFRKCKLKNGLHKIIEDGREILEYSQIEGFNHLANRNLHYSERYIGAQEYVDFLYLIYGTKMHLITAK